MMRVLLVCQDTGENVGWSFRRLLPQFGHSVAIIDEEQYFGRLPGSLWQRVFNRLAGHPPAYGRFNRDVCRMASQFQPDLVLVLKGGHLSPQTLRWVKRETRATLINYCLDDFFPLNARAITPGWHAGIPVWDAIVTTKRYNVEELKTRGAKRAVFVRCGYDPLVHYPVSVSAEEQSLWGSDVLFIGTYEAERAQFLEYLAGRHVCKLRIYGNGWASVTPRSPLYPYTLRQPLYGHQKRLALSSARIALAFLRKANRDTYSDRSFEIPACRAFMLAERSREHQLLYDEGQEIECFSTRAELVEKAVYYSEHAHERQAIAEAGYRRVLQDGHTYEHRLEEILKVARDVQQVEAG